MMGNANNLPSTSAAMMTAQMGQQNAVGVGMPIGANAPQQRQQNPAAALMNQMNTGPSIQQMKQNQQLASGLFTGGNAMNPNTLAQQRQQQQQQQAKNVRNPPFVPCTSAHGQLTVSNQFLASHSNRIK